MRQIAQLKESRKVRLFHLSREEVLIIVNLGTVVQSTINIFPFSFELELSLP